MSTDNPSEWLSSLDFRKMLDGIALQYAEFANNGASENLMRASVSLCGLREFALQGGKVQADHSARALL